MAAPFSFSGSKERRRKRGNRIVWFNRDKTKWGPGPWLKEPDKVQWVDKSTGLDCLITRHRLGGFLCGYVGIPSGHPLHGKDYGEVSLRAHYEVNFSETCAPEGPDGFNICHIPLPERPDDLWWFGFDCGHGSDYAPGYEGPIRFTSSLAKWQKYRTYRYVKKNCELLALQLRAAEHG